MPTKKIDVIPLDRLRGEIWVNACMRAAGVKSLMALWRETLDIVPDRTSWSHYKAGTVKPIKDTVAAINYLFPGTASLWNLGPFKLPFWAILKSDTSACDKYLRQFLTRTYIPVGSILDGAQIDSLTLSKCLLGLLQSTLPREVWCRHKSLDIQPYVDELYEHRRRIIQSSDVQEFKLSPAPVNSYVNPVLDELAQSYYAKGLLPPWEEDLDTVEGVDEHENPRQPVTTLPVSGISIEDFLAAFYADPDCDEEFEIDYESSPIKSLRYVPLKVKQFAYDLIKSRVPSSKRFFSLSLSDLLVISPNPLLACYQKYMIKNDGSGAQIHLKKFNGLDRFTPPLFTYSTLLAFIAAIFLCRSSRNSAERKVADFLWEGVHLAIKSQFNQEVYDTVKP